MARAWGENRSTAWRSPTPAWVATKEAREILRRLDEWARTHYVSLMMRAEVHASLGEMDSAVTLLQHSLDTRESMFVMGRSMPELAPILDDQRVKRLLD